MLKHQPATPLPWYPAYGLTTGAVHSKPLDEQCKATRLTLPNMHRSDAAYIAHAANAYPKLVEDLREGHAAKAVSLLLAWVEEGAQGMPNPDTLNDAVTFARLAKRNREALLRHIGENI